MIDSATSTGFQPRPIVTLPPPPQLFNAPAMKDEILPFTVRLVRNDEDLKKAVQIRHSAYARHLPEFAETLRKPECEDAEDGVVVLLAESKLDGSPIGTMRIHTNQFKPICVEKSIKLPEWLNNRRLAEATRLGITNEKGGRLVTTILFKAYFQYCQQIGVEWLVIAGRAPIDRQYERLLFEDVYPGIGYVPLAHANKLPHRIMSFNVETAESRWKAVNHPLLGFMCHTYHPDIRIGAPSHHRSSSCSIQTLSSSAPAFRM